MANKGNDFAYARDTGDQIEVWTGEQKIGRDGSADLNYHQRNKFAIEGEFVDIDFSPKLSTADYNAFLVTINNNGTIETYQYNTENNTPNHKSLVASSESSRLLDGVIAQAFGPDVVNKGNDFRYVRETEDKLEFWIGEQQTGGNDTTEIEYHQRGRTDFGLF